MARTGTGFEPPGTVDEHLGEFFSNTFLDIQSLNGRTRLAGVAECSPNGGIGGELEICIGKYDHRVLAAELENDRSQIFCCGLGDPLASCNRAGEHYLVRRGVDES